MGKLALVVLCVIAGPLAAQTKAKLGKNDVRVVTDEFTGHTHALSKRVRLDGVPDGMLQQVYLSYQRFTPKGDSVSSYQIFVNYEGSEWMFIEEGESLIFLLDGQPLPLSSRDGSSDKRDVYGSKVYERAMYQVAPEQLRQIAKASTIKVRIKGSKFTIDAKPDASNFDLLRAFNEVYLPPEE